ncbi:MAG: phage major capsid protein [Balneolaceae bacterium]
MNKSIETALNTPIRSLDMQNDKLVLETRGDLLKGMRSCIEQMDIHDNKGETEKAMKAELNYEKIRSKVVDLDNMIDNSDNPDTKRWLSNNGNGGEQFKFGSEIGMTSRNSNPNVQKWEAVSGKNKGAEIKVLNNRASFVDVYGYQPDSPEMNWGNYLRGRIAGHTGNQSIQGPKNFMSTSSDTALVPTPLSASVIDLARNKSRIFQAGAQAFEMSSKTETIARITGDPTASWKEENASHSSSEVSTEPLTFTAKTLIASVKMSVELSEDAPNGAGVIENSISEQLALELDRAALMGSGEGAEPQGVVGYTGVQAQPVNATLDSYDPFSQAYQKVLEKNGEPTGIIHAPRTWGQLDRLKDSQNQPLVAPASYQELQKYATNQIPVNLGTGEDESLAILASWAQMMVGIRTNIRLEVTRVASDSENSAFEDLQVWVRAYLRADIQLAQPGQFVVLEGLGA